MEEEEKKNLVGKAVEAAKKIIEIVNKDQEEDNEHKSPKGPFIYERKEPYSGKEDD